MPRDDRIGRLPREQPPPQPDDEVLRRRINSAWSRLIRKDHPTDDAEAKPPGDTTTTPERDKERPDLGTTAEASP